jgi:hypothetical protein
VQVGPLRQITGEPEFNELFIEGGAIPGANPARRPSNGWKVGADHAEERARRPGLLPAGQAAAAADELSPRRQRAGCSTTPVNRRPAGTRSTLLCEVLRLTAYRGLTAIVKYGQPGPEGSLTKWMCRSTPTRQLTQLAGPTMLGPRRR